MDADAADENTNKNKTIVTEAKAAECNIFLSFISFSPLKNVNVQSMTMTFKTFLLKSTFIKIIKIEIIYIKIIESYF
jgi:hypothetical protein